MGPLLVLLAAMTAGAAAQECYRGVCVRAQDNSSELYCSLNVTCKMDGDCAGLECAGEFSDETLDSIDWALVVRVLDELLPELEGILETAGLAGSREEFLDNVLNGLLQLFALDDEEGGEVPLEIEQSTPTN